MENLAVSFGVVLPLFLMMALGYVLRLIRLLDEHTLSALNNLTFRIFLPVLLFYNISTTRLEQAFNLRLMLYAAVCVTISFGAVFLLIPLAEKEPRKQGVLVQGIFRSNFIIFGLPVTVSLLGPEHTGVTSILIAMVIPMYNVFSVVALEFYCHSKCGCDGRLDLKQLFRGILTNPLILGAAAGILALAVGLKLPAPVERTVGDLAKVATPLALIGLGGSFYFGKTRGYLKQIILGVAGRLLVIPGIFIPVSIFLGFRGEELIALVSMFTAPTAVSSFTMAEQMDGDGELASYLVVFGSACSVVTIFFWVFLIRHLGFFA